MKLLAPLAFAVATAKHQGAVKIKQDGETLNLHIAALEDKVTTNGDAVTMTWGGEVRAFVTLRETDDMPANNFYNFSLFNKELSYEVDLSQVGCSCNAALFFTSMPGYHKNGTVARGAFNPYYCDANNVGGVRCWEHDSIEANRHALHITPHGCDAPAGGYIDDCDKEGCAASVVDTDSGAMCPDRSCLIDTRKPFRIFQRYEGNAAGELVRMIHRMEQPPIAGFVMEVCEPSYVIHMADFFKGQMVMVFQLWGESYEMMEWLDKKSGCTGDCDKEAAKVTFSNIQINSIEPAGRVAVVV